MKSVIRTLVAAVALAAGATTADAQVQQQNPNARGSHSSFYYGRTAPTPRSDPVNAPTINANPLNRPVGRYGPVTPVPEPSEWAMLLAGLALVGFIVRRNSKRS
jgi:hypothetical protein